MKKDCESTHCHSNIPKINKNNIKVGESSKIISFKFLGKLLLANSQCPQEPALGKYMKIFRGCTWPQCVARIFLIIQAKKNT